MDISREDSSNIPQNPAYGIYTSRLNSIARACDHYIDFEKRHNGLCEKLFKQGFKYYKLVKQLRKTLVNHRELFTTYGNNRSAKTHASGM